VYVEITDIAGHDCSEVRTKIGFSNREKKTASKIRGLYKKERVWKERKKLIGGGLVVEKWRGKIGKKSIAKHTVREVKENNREEHWSKQQCAKVQKIPV